MREIVVTAGRLHTDIDVLACAVSYCELARIKEVNCRAVLGGPLNNSVTDEVRSWGAEFESKPGNVGPETDFVIVDISEPENIAEFVNQKRIVEIYDHHFGFEDYWKNKPGIKAVIEEIGACATLIWEEWRKQELDHNMSQISAKLLYTAIVSNTLNFKAGVTRQRDIEASLDLASMFKPDDDFVQRYFRDQEKEVYLNPERAIKDDTVPVNFPNLPFPLTIGQLELWDSGNFMKQYLTEAEAAMTITGNKHWFLTSPSISEGKNYLFTKNQEVKSLLEQVLGVKFAGDIAQTEKLILRKEIKRLLLVV